MISFEPQILKPKVERTLITLIVIVLVSAECIPPSWSNWRPRVDSVTSTTALSVVPEG